MAMKSTKVAKAPTATQLQFLRMLHRLDAKLGRAATDEELKQACGYANKSGAQDMIRRLRRDGLIEEKIVRKRERTISQRGKTMLGIE